ncbi:MAG: rhomboid family intramembrane serine protease [Anaerolineae bacterium]
MFPLRDTVRSRSTPVVNYLIIAVNVIVFIAGSSLGARRYDAVVTNLGMVPARLLADLSLAQAGTLFASMFLHGGWFHLLSNMWALFIFGDNVEDRVGHGRYLLFYLLGGLAAAGAYLLVSPGSTVPVIGASGAISAVMGGYLLLFPRSRVLTLIPIFIFPWFVEVPAIVFIGFWFVSQVFNGLFSLVGPDVGTYGGVAWWAHVGGFVFGLLLVKLFAAGRRYRQFRADEYWPW